MGGGGGEPAGVRRQVATGVPDPTVPAADVSYGAPMVQDAAPISLTSSDGAGLALVRLDARAAVDGPLAFTELHLTFANPEDRVLEGRFAITLPDGAAVSRFAMKIDGAWMEAEMVERMAARRAYEDFLHKAQDPALLEKEAGNEFRARVFPIAANAEKEIIIAYSQELADPDAPFVVPLKGLPRIGDVSASIRVARVDGAALRWDETTLHETGWQPDRDLAVPGSGAAHALGAPGIVAMRVAPEIAAEKVAIAELTLLVDTSASRALGYATYAREVEALVARLAAEHAGLEIVVAAFDQEVAPLYRGAAAGAAGKIEPALLARLPLGASDLASALAWVKADGGGGKGGRVVVVSDGVATAGETDTAKLGAAVAALKGGVARLDVVLAGGIRDRDVAVAVTRGRLAQDGAVLELDDGADEVARRIGLATRSGVKVAVDGAAWVWPERLDGLQPGDAAMVYAAMKGGEGGGEVRVRLGDQRLTLAVEPAAAPLVSRAAIAAEIARLEARVGEPVDGKGKKAERARGARQQRIDAVVALSMKHRVLSSYTALLVLETEEDYARFGIDRKALAGILVVGNDGVEVQGRAEAVMIAAEDVVEPDDEDGDGEDDEKEKDIALEPPAPGEPETEEEGAGGEAYGVIGTGSYGYGAGSGSGAARGHAVRVPSVRIGAAGASGGGGRARDDEDEDMPPEPKPEPDADPSLLEPQMDETAESAANGPAAYDGRMATVMELLAGGKLDDALTEALAWRGAEPGAVMALVGLGEVYEAKQQPALAGRAYGSIIDLFPARADLRRFAGERLDRLAMSGAGASVGVGALAVDTYRKAVEQRPDHLLGHRELAFALVRAGKLDEAFAALEHGLAQTYPEGRFAEGVRILKEDLGMVAAAWKAKAPKRAGEIARRLARVKVQLATAPSLRFVLTWQTDANDVDFHIRDAQGGHAYYEAKTLASGGELYADVTDGYGPENFTIKGTPKAGPYRLSIHYYSRGPMGYGMGKLEVVRHDGKGTLAFEERPFVVMNDGAFVDLGAVE